ncbi:arylsulfotransferase family protein [Salinifilum ghardaiensis]
MPERAQRADAANCLPRSGRRGPRTAAVIVLALACAGLTGGSTGPFREAGHRYVTRPDLHPPRTEVTVPPRGTEDGYILRSPVNSDEAAIPTTRESPGQSGALITDERGEPVWFHPAEPGEAIFDLQKQQYRGQPVLTYWEGDLIAPPGYGEGTAVIRDRSYREIARVQAGNGFDADIHEFRITPRGTALLLGYRAVPADLRPVGGPADGRLLENAVQEVDIETGEVLLDWRATEHIGLDESYLELPEDTKAVPWDYFHVNSVNLDHDGNLLLSARNTHAVYKIDRNTGRVQWRLNGTETDYSLPPEAQFQWQHDAQRRPDGTISLFDNGVPEKERSRGLVLRLDEEAGTAEAVREDWRPAPELSPNMGNYQLLGSGNAFTGWGGGSGYTEFGPDRSVRHEAELSGGLKSYRAYREPWVGRPATDPDVATRPDGDGTAVHASWNGATEVARWRVRSGPAPDRLTPEQEVPRRGFETGARISTTEGYVAVEALDEHGEVLGRSEPTRIA